MAYFAELDDNNLVTRVVVVANEDLLDESGLENEEIGIQICQNLISSNKWVQTSFNTRDGMHYDPVTGLPDDKEPFRNTFAEIGFYFSEQFQAFTPPPPKPWFFLNENLQWECPANIGPKTGFPFTHDELLYIGHLVNTNKIYSIVPVKAVDSDPLANICTSTEYGLADITEITHGENPHTWFYLDDNGEFNIDYQKDYSVELDLTPFGVITSFTMNDDNEKSNRVAKFCFEQHPQNEAFSLHECFRLIIEWAFAYTDLNNREPMAELAHNFLRVLQMPAEVRNDLLNNVPGQVVALFLNNDDIYTPFYRTESVEAPSSFISWIAQISDSYRSRALGDPFNFDASQVSESYPI